MQEDDKTIFPIEDDDKTVFRLPSAHNHTITPLLIELYNAQHQIIQSFSAAENITVGRAVDNTVVVDHTTISRHHLEIKLENKQWWVYNTSVNGIYIDNQRIDKKIKLNLPVIIKLSNSGLYLTVSQESEKNDQKTLIALSPPANAVSQPPILSPSPVHLLKQTLESRYIAEQEPDNMSDHTQLFRQLIQKDRIKRGKSYKKTIKTLGVLVTLAVGVITYQQFALANARKLAIDMFYDIKSIEVSLLRIDIHREQSNVKIEQSVAQLNKELIEAREEKNKKKEADILKALAEIEKEKQQIAKEKQYIAAEREKLAQTRKDYRQYVQDANSLKFSFFGDQHTKELITKVAYGLGESELELPDDFIAEVEKYINLWNRPDMNNAMNTAWEKNYIPFIQNELKAKNLPLAFLFIALQESKFNPNAVGLETQYGRAKGMWQFIPTTAQAYGLKVSDPDERFDFAKATHAAAKYLKYIYSTRAQASGLLVMASYNWGEGNVIKHLKEMNYLEKMPANPRQRNFWTFSQQFDMPQETYDYVLRIFAAAVIGEDPAYFGFKFAPPLLAAKNDTLQ
jgi:membrane-bound lytic murein transglycosylase D